MYSETMDSGTLLGEVAIDQQTKSVATAAFSRK